MFRFFSLLSPQEWYFKRVVGRNSKADDVGYGGPGRYALGTLASAAEPPTFGTTSRRTQGGTRAGRRYHVHSNNYWHCFIPQARTACSCRHRQRAAADRPDQARPKRDGGLAPGEGRQAVVFQ
jgi:hypothetical protein